MLASASLTQTVRCHGVGMWLDSCEEVLAASLLLCAARYVRAGCWFFQVFALTLLIELEPAVVDEVLEIRTDMSS